MNMKNNESLDFADWTTKKLKDEYRDTSQSQETGWCSTNVHNLIGIEIELNNRGVEINSTPTFN